MRTWFGSCFSFVLQILQVLPYFELIVHHNGIVSFLRVRDFCTRRIGRYLEFTGNKSTAEDTEMPAHALYRKRKEHSLIKISIDKADRGLKLGKTLTPSWVADQRTTKILSLVCGVGPDLNIILCQSLVCLK